MFKKGFPWSRRSAETAERDNVLLQGERIVLREKSLADIEDDYGWRTDPELAELDATRPLNMSYDDFYRYSRDEINLPGIRSKRLSVDDIDGEHIGNCMFYDIDMRAGEAELGIMIGDKDYWSQGFGTETVDLLLDHMFLAYSFKRVYLHTLTWNHRAQKSFRKSGFKDLKEVRRSGLNFLNMEIWRHEWERMRGAEMEDDQTSNDISSSENSNSPS
ncbi:MAG: GNAT family N-acetyltransferase [SAR202 cluster bacterium]|nr:GNAT family N-acetyltransferase [SAR202 cluster bacterium]MDP6300823.1 GNAT family N-acetyltransferase [SAR202 cluster bacterium]MDP7104534.1 GNAT family N-acetyltransferase [SAR202 cluster bacterium]MDP7226197.1 GNAT family N-acetyltransferase [SAR202 cluster bacterium]MDP7414452.1 GNAT family N-acetyltransferase [SAR202 cluster bacterium]